ncbi:NAD(P)H dehydrogenase (quinone) [Methylobacterium sp. PvP062]|jgi:NAD(P)H dehydrogenase (quinone)|uniref:NAD(P)H dehydrogenase (Quinone) n=1 Tax=Methylobacterium radiotolerans TaxID=31998 RepID=A0ABV2ND01_9HYPH|nr:MULTISPECIES: NmrA family NAD(P)-binding protein [unclassified Methylobacterium]MBP2492387.1 NAD(P)H dehydrogenase (quinone) [Methylobacterium sp. PvP105]MBP2501242.1 NAD(P)H dehydrogenase (quinone) [Methylobacterium sp. PvP109]MCX7334158.1 NmrA family NAD(P)-binding protein [Hyphomicrobiales bacterium]
MTQTDYPSYFVTGATGQLGRQVIAALLERIPAGAVVAGARDIEGESARSLRSLGVAVRRADYADPTSLDAAFQGIQRLLLISSSEIGRRVAQHRNVIDSAGRTGVGLIAYTSVLHADTSALALAEEHRQTERLLADSGVPFVVLRNGWYTENYAAGIAPALAHGAVLGCAGDGRIASAARVDYAAAAAAVLTAEGQGGRIYELAGDESYTLTEFAAAIAAAAGRPVAYRDLPQAEYRAALVAAGIPSDFAALLADSDAAAARGALDDDTRQLSALIGRPTTPYRSTVHDAVARL